MYKLRKINYKKLTEHLALVVGIIQPLTALPQIMLLADGRDASGVSLWSWLLPDISGLFFLAYGISHKLRPIIVTQALWFILQTIVVVQIILYD